MEPSEEILVEVPPFFKIYKNGRIERLLGTQIVPPSTDPDPKTGVSSKDVIIDHEKGISARLYLPKITNPSKKLPLLIYFHGGAFCIETAFSPTYHHYLNSLVAEANVVAVSIDYRRAPEHPVPIAYEDSWVALKWVLSHLNGDGSELWINTHVDFDRVFLAGDSAGANISHNMAIRAGVCDDDRVKLLGVALIHPYFWGVEPVGNEGVDMERKKKVDQIWLSVCPLTSGCDDPLINPVTDSNLSRLACSKMLVCVAGKDILRDRGWLYYEAMKKSGWNGDVEIVETEGEEHVFHLSKPTCEKAEELMKCLASFMNE